MKDLNVLLDILPHQPPMKMLDHIVYIDEQQVHAIKKVCIEEPYFVGHFPGNPIFPGVLMIETMAQAGGLLILKKQANMDHPGVFYLAQVQEAKFIKPVIPNASLDVKVSLLGFKKGFYKFSGEIWHKETLVAQAQWTCFYQVK